MLFQKNPTKALDAARVSRDKLTQRLTDAEANVQIKRSAAQALARSGADDSALDKAEAILRAAQDRVSTLAAALVETNAELAVLEADQAAAADKAQRADTADKIKDDAARLIEAAKMFDDGAKALAEIATDIATFVPDAAGLAVFAASVRSEVPPALDLLHSVMQSFAQSVLAGSAPAKLPSPAPVAAPVLLAPPTTRVFSTKPVTWTDHGGTRQTAHAWLDLDMPPTVATKALKIAAAVPMNSPVRNTKLGFARTSAKPKPSDCVNLDADAPLVSDPRATAPVLSQHKPAAQPAAQPMFTPVDRGKPFVVRTARAAE
jgi:hypothetical protein